MSTRLQRLVYQAPLHPIAKHVLAAIAWHARDELPRVWLSKRRLAELTGYSRRTVQRVLAGARDEGVLVTVNGAAGGDPRHGTTYDLRLDRLRLPETGSPGLPETGSPGLPETGSPGYRGESDPPKRKVLKMKVLSRQEVRREYLV